MIVITQFSGEIPRTNPARLPDGAASYAENCDFSDGTLRGLPANEAPAKPFVQGTKDAFMYDLMHKYAFSEDIDAVRHPGVNLAAPRWAFTGDTTRSPIISEISTAVETSVITNPFNGQQLGVPAPRSAPELSADFFPFGHLIAAINYHNANEHENGGITDKVRIENFNTQFVNGVRTQTTAVNSPSSRKGYLIADQSYRRIDQGGNPTLDILRSYGANIASNTIYSTILRSYGANIASNTIYSTNQTGYGAVKRSSLYLSHTLGENDWNNTTDENTGVVTYNLADTSKCSDPVEAIYCDNYSQAYFKLPAGRSSAEQIDGVINPNISGSTAITFNGVSTTVKANGGMPFVRCESRPGEPSPSRWYYSLAGYERKKTMPLGPGVTESQRSAMLGEMRKSPVVLNWAESTSGRVARGPVMIVDIWLARAATAEDGFPGATVGQLIDSDFINSGSADLVWQKQQIVQQRFTKVQAILRKDPAQNTWPSELPQLSMRIEWGATDGTQPTDMTYFNYLVYFTGKYANTQARAYVYTYVNEWGEEGPPSAPLFLDSVPEAGRVALTVKYQSWEPYRYSARQKIRLYRTATGTTTDFMFVGEYDCDDYALTPAAQTKQIFWGFDSALHTVSLTAHDLITGYYQGYPFHLYGGSGHPLYTVDSKRFSDATVASLELSATISDKLTDEQLGETLSTTNYHPPLFVNNDEQADTSAGKPRQLRGLCAMHNGMFAAFERNNVWISEPYLPYAWNPSSVQSLPDEVTGICPADNALYVATIKGCYLLSGTSPDAMTNVKVSSYAGVSRRSITQFGNFIVYASLDGLVLVQGMNASLDVSNTIFTQVDWQKMWGGLWGDMRIGVSGNTMLIYAQNASGSNAICIRKDGNALVMTHYTPASNVRLVASFNLDLLHVVEGSVVRTFSTSLTARTAFEFSSKHFDLPTPISFSAVQVEGYGQATIKVYSGFNTATDAELLQNLLTTQTVTLDGKTTLRLPTNTKSRRWMVTVAGAANTYVYKIVLASSMTELKGA